MEEVERANESARRLRGAETRERHEQIVDAKDAADDFARDLEPAGVELSEGQATLLDRAFRVIDATATEDWPQVLAGGLERLRDWATAAQRRVRDPTEKREAMFARYDEQWEEREERERTTAIDALPDYLRILENLQRSGFAENMDGSPG